MQTPLRPAYFLINIFCVLLSTSRPSFAAELSEKALADKLHAYRLQGDTSVRFEQIKHLTEMNLNLKSSGQMHIGADGQILWEIEKPSPVKVRLSPDEIRVTRPSGEQTYKIQELPEDNAAKGIGMIRPWLTMDAKVLAAQYRVNQTAANTFEFEPRSPQALRKITALLGADGHVEKLDMLEASGDSLEIKFSHLKRKP